MSVSLTKDGLYLEPRVYINDSSGANYGTPRLVATSFVSKSLGGGTWSGLCLKHLSDWNRYDLLIESNVSTSSGGEVFTSESLDNSRKGGGLDGNILELKRFITKLSNFNSKVRYRFSSRVHSSFLKFGRRYTTHRDLGYQFRFLHFVGTKASREFPRQFGNEVSLATYLSNKEVA